MRILTIHQQFDSCFGKKSYPCYWWCNENRTKTKCPSYHGQNIEHHCWITEHISPKSQTTNKPLLCQPSTAGPAASSYPGYRQRTIAPNYTECTVKLIQSLLSILNMLSSTTPSKCWICWVCWICWILKLIQSLLSRIWEFWLSRSKAGWSIRPAILSRLWRADHLSPETHSTVTLWMVSDRQWNPTGTKIR